MGFYPFIIISPKLSPDGTPQCNISRTMNHLVFHFIESVIYVINQDSELLNYLITRESTVFMIMIPIIWIWCCPLNREFNNNAPLGNTLRMVNYAICLLCRTLKPRQNNSHIFLHLPNWLHDWKLCIFIQFFPDYHINHCLTLVYVMTKYYFFSPNFHLDAGAVSRSSNYLFVYVAMSREGRVCTISYALHMSLFCCALFYVIRGAFQKDLWALKSKSS